ncbi:MAG: TIGR02921 family PEP-CTERM protein [Myxococcota bacterium]
MGRVRTLLTHGFAQLLFWSWNLLFGAIVLGELPGLARDLVREAWHGALPWDLAAISLVILASPFLAVAAWVPLRKDPKKVFRLLFGIEAPLLLAGLVRLALLREVTPSVLYLLLVIGLAGFVLMLDLYRKRTASLSLPELAGHAVLLVTAGWVGAVLVFYAPPVAVFTVHAADDLFAEFARFRWLGNPFRTLMSVVFGSFAVLTMSLFVVFPVAFFGIYLGTFARLFRETAARVGRVRTGLAATIGVIVTLAPLVPLDRQPQIEAFARLEAPPADDATRRALVHDVEQLRAGLLDAYLARHRYWTSSGEASHVGQMYSYSRSWRTPTQRAANPQPTWGDKISAGAQARGDYAQGLYNVLTRPFVYQGESLTGDSRRAAALYANFFDLPIQKGEQAAVSRALNATWDRSTVEAGLLDVNGEKVHLARQALTVAVIGDLATVQLDETYRNETLDRQEIFYFFTLPESAAVTGLWLSDDPAVPEKFPGVFAPRGAAQQVYLEQRQERRDPALLEQVGPRQYRLRAFPILGRAREGTEGAPLTVRLTYTTPVTAEGVPLPRLLERRNIYWDDRTERTGMTIPAAGILDRPVAGGDPWLPPLHPATVAVPRAHRVTVGEGVVVTATPNVEARAVPAGHRYAVVLDRSYSMRAHASEATEALAYLRDTVGARNDLDLYVTAGWGAGEPVRLDAVPADPDVLWYGSLLPDEMLAQYDVLRADQRYDAVLLLTDAGTYDFAATVPRGVPETGGPLWMVHLGGALAPAYDDAVLEAIQRSGGGVATSVAEVVDRLAVWDAHGVGVDAVDGYLWRVEEGVAEGVAEAADPTFAALAARRYVLHQARTADMADVASLDAAHAVAKAAGVVTPYSSLLALVDDAQRQRLAALEAAEDRFTREGEAGVETLTAPEDLFAVTAVPEPEEWALLLLGGALLVATQRRRLQGVMGRWGPAR